RAPDGDRGESKPIRGHRTALTSRMTPPFSRDERMSSEGSVTRLIGMLKEGDRAASQRLWEAYFGRLVGLARARLRGTVRAPADEEDVALSAFDSFFRRAERGQFPQLHDRDDLWQLLFVLTVRKAINLVHHHGRKSRGGGRVLSLADLDGVG